jgi:hypothetical protein
MRAMSRNSQKSGAARSKKVSFRANSASGAKKADLPSNWETIEVGRVCRIENGCPFESPFFNELDGIPLIRIRDVHSGHSETFYSGPYAQPLLKPARL